METSLVVSLLALSGVLEALYWPFGKASDPQSELAAATPHEPVSRS